MASTTSRKRGRYCCSHCGLPKKGHVCIFAGELSAPAPAPVTVPPVVDLVADADYISALPDDILGTIISLLPTIDAVCTQTISPRWIHLWRSSAPLNLNDSDLQRRVSGDNLVSAITHILSTPRLPCARRLCLTTLSRHSGDVDRYRIFDGWLCSPVLDHLDELRFGYARELGNAPLQPLESMPPLPPSALRFSSLQDATYELCHFPLNLAGVYFPNLISLTLSRTTNFEKTLHDMIAACPALQTLFIDRNYYFRRVHISSQSLVSVRLLVDPNYSVMDELFIVNTPNLAKLILQDEGNGPRTIRVIVAPKLQMFGGLSTDMMMMPTVQPCKTVFQAMVDSSLRSSFQNVKILDIIVKSLKLNHAIDVLKCFPCLQKLHIRSLMYRVLMRINDKPADGTAECIHKHLKQLEVTDYSGKISDVNFVKFFVLNARVLELVKLHIPFSFHNKWMSKQRKQMNFMNRASPNAMIHFEG